MVGRRAHRGSGGYKRTACGLCKPALKGIARSGRRGQGTICGIVGYFLRIGARRRAALGIKGHCIDICRIARCNRCTGKIGHCRQCPRAVAVIRRRAACGGYAGQRVSGAYGRRHLDGMPRIFMIYHCGACNVGPIRNRYVLGFVRGRNGHVSRRIVDRIPVEMIRHRIGGVAFK